MKFLSLNQGLLLSYKKHLAIGYSFARKFRISTGSRFQVLVEVNLIKYKFGDSEDKIKLTIRVTQDEHTCCIFVRKPVGLSLAALIFCNWVGLFLLERSHRKRAFKS